MNTLQASNRDVVATTRDTTVAQAARLMRENHVGCIVVVDGVDPRRPVGLVTDRDIVVEVLAAEVDQRTVTVGEIMSEPLVVARADSDAMETLQLMCRKGIRRVPVVDAAGALAGIVSLDDLLRLAASTLEALAGAIGLEQSVESRRRSRLVEAGQERAANPA